MNRNILELKGIRKSFGSFCAVAGVDLKLKEGEIHSIIGPNGAGKTTLFNLITNRLRSDTGKIIFLGKPINHLPAYEIVRLGIAKSFQIVSIYPGLTVFENILCPVMNNLKMNRWFFSNPMSDKRVSDQVHRILKSVELEINSHLRADALSQGDKKRLDLGICLACEPKVMLLDEPTAGMSPEETESTTALIKKIARERGITTLFTEHDMSVVFSISDRTTVLQAGKIIAQGRPDEVKENSAVIKAYLGDDI